MADDDINQSTAYVVRNRGYFWWDDKLSPDRHHFPPSAVTGELKITPEGRVTVQLDGMLPRQRSRTTSYSDFISAAIKKNNALGPLCHALALTEIGLDPAAVRAWAVETPPAFRRNWYFAEVGLIDHADPNARSQVATAAR